MSSADTENPLMGLIRPAWINTYLVENALEQYEAITQYAKELNKAYGHFWGMTQKFALDAAVMGICKLYDETNKRYKKHTIPELILYLKENFSSSHISLLKQESLCSLNISECGASATISSFIDSAQFEQAKVGLLDRISTVAPVSTDPPLERLFTYRDKFSAHQEQVSEAVKEQMKFLPSLKDIHMLNNWAKNFCMFMVNIFVQDIALVPSAVSGYMATLNIVAKVIGKNFNDLTKSDSENWAERERFYKRLE